MRIRVKIQVEVEALEDTLGPTILEEGGATVEEGSATVEEDVTGEADAKH